MFNEGKSFASLANFIGLERYQTKSNELEKLVIETVRGTNYRRAVKDLERDGKLPVLFHTARGWVLRRDCDESKISPKSVMENLVGRRLLQITLLNCNAVPIRDVLSGVLAIELPQDDFQKVSEQEKSDIEERVEKAELAIDKPIGYFNVCGYSTAATYIRRAKCGMFDYIRRWLKWGLISPRASSMVERVMRELGRRLKKTACGCSDKGATKISRIILKRFTNAREWEDYWLNKMNCAGNVVINIGIYKCFSQNLGQ